MKNYIKIIAILAQINVSTYALECTNSSEITNEYSLRSKGQPLENMITQDQGSLGTCYANALALAIEAKTKQKLSVQQLAINSKEPNITLVESRTKSYAEGDTNIDELYYEGGNFCRTFNASKNKNICTRENSPIEDYTHQGMTGVILPLSQFYDAMGPNSKLENKKQLEKIMMNVQNEIDSKIKSCIDYRNEENGLPPNNAGIIKFVEEQLTKKYKNFDELWQKCLLEENRFEVITYNNDGTRNITGAQDHCYGELEQLKSELNNLASIDDPRLSENSNLKSFTNDNYKISEYNQVSINSGTPPKYTFPRESTKFFHEYFKILPTIHNQFLTSKEKKDLLNDFFQSNKWNKNQSASESLTQGSTPSRLILLTYQDWEDFDFDNCRFKILSRLYPGKIQKIYEESFQMCVGIEFANLHLEVFESLAALGYDPANISTPMSEILSKMDQPMQQYLMGIINQNCLNEIPNTFVDIHLLELKCTSLNWPNSFQLLNYEKRVAKAKRILNNHIEKYLIKNKTPINISICTGFLNNPDFDSKMGSECNLSNKHGRHSVNIIGSRCREGKIEYQIQNSWGDTCDAYYNEKNELIYPCNEEQGNFWVNENILVKNIVGINIIEGKRK